MKRLGINLYVACVILVLVAVGLLAFFPVVSDDLFLYLSWGRIFFQTGHFPTVDPFLFPAALGHLQIMEEWGSFLVFSAIHSIGSWTGLVIFKTAVVLAASAVPILLARRLKYQSPMVPLLVLSAAFAASPRFIERSEIFSDLFTALVLAALVAYDRRPGKFILFLPLIFVFWVNLHAGFPVGLFFLAVFLGNWIIRQRRGRWKVFSWLALGSFAGCLVNPLGIGGFLYPFQFVFRNDFAVYRQSNYEWMPTYSAAYRMSLPVLIFFLMLLGGAILLYLSRKKKPWPELVVYLFLSYLGLSAIHYVPVAVFALAVLYTGLASGLRLLLIRNPVRVEKSSRVRVVILGVCLASILVIIARVVFNYSFGSGVRKVGGGLDLSAYPFGAAEFIDRNNLTTPLFNQHEFGGFLAWDWEGRRKIFFHGAVDDPHFYQTDYLGVDRSPEDFERVVGKYKIGAFLLANYNFNPVNPPLVYQILLTSPEWKLVYQDPVAILFVKDIPQNQTFLTNAERNPK